MGGLYVDWVMFGGRAVMPTAIKSNKGALLEDVWMPVCRRATCCCKLVVSQVHGWVAGTRATRLDVQIRFRTAAGIGLSRVIETADSAPTRPNCPTPSRRLRSLTVLKDLFVSYLLR